jgi:tetratricopeptide (TPR) repeat protein
MMFRALIGFFLILCATVPVKAATRPAVDGKGSPPSSLGKPALPTSALPDPSAVEVSVIHLLHLSREALGAGRLDEALKWSQAAAAKDPAYHEAWKQLGRVRMLMGNYPEALKAFQLSRELKAEDLEVEEWTLRSLLASDRLPELVQRLEKVPPPLWKSLDPSFRFQLLLQAMETPDRHLKDKVLVVLDRPDSSSAFKTVLEALRLISRNRWEEGKKTLERGTFPMEERPFAALGWFFLGQGYQKISETEEAVWAYQKAIAFNPEFIPPYREMGWLLKRSGKKAEAIEIWNKGFQKDPRQTTWLLWMAETRLENKQPNEALDLLNRYLKSHPYNINARLLKLTALALSGRKQEEAAYEKQIRQEPEGEKLILLSRGLTLQKQGKYEAAARLLEDYVRRHPRDLLARKFFIDALSLWAASQPGRPALEPLEKLARLDPHRPGIQRDLGWSLFAHNRFSEAVQAWERALKDPAVDRKRLILQVVAGLAEEGQTQRAKELFRKWEPGGSFTPLGLEVLKVNRVIAARVFFQEAWDSGEDRVPLGLYLAYSEARTGYCSRVPEHLHPVVTAGLTQVPREDLPRFLFALSQCSYESALLPLLIGLDEMTASFPEVQTEVTAVLSKAAAEQRRYNNLPEAWLLYQKVIQRDPDRVREWLAAAETAEDMGKGSEVAPLLEEVAHRSKSAAVKEGIKGWQARIQNDLPKAVFHFYQSLAVESDQPELRFLLFKDLLVLKRFDEARAQSEWFKQRVASGEIILKSYLAQTLSLLGKPQEALGYWQELYLGNPERTVYAVETARALLAVGRAEEALSLMKTASSKTPDNRVFETLAEIYSVLGRAEEVLKTAEGGLAIKPTTELWRYQAEAAEALKRPSQALMAAQKWAAADPGNPSPHQIWAKALLDLGETEEARTFLKSLLKRNPQFLPSLVHLREIASTEKRSGEAVEYSRETVRQRPWDPHAKLQHAVSLAEDERFIAAYGLLHPMAPKAIHRAIPVLMYRGVTTFPYPGRNTVSQVKAHLELLAAHGYTFITPSDLPEAFKKEQRQVMVVILETDTEPLKQLDAVLEKINGKAVWAGDYRALQTQVPFQGSPELLSRLRSSGRWVTAWTGPTGNDLRAVVAEKGVRGNVLTHRLLSDKRRETPEEMEGRLEKAFSEAAASLKKYGPPIFIYPGGDYGQVSLDNDFETVEILRRVLSRHFGYALFADPNGYILEGSDPLRLMGRQIPPSWDEAALTAYLTRQNPLVKARLQLAKVYFWQGQHLEAGRWFKEAEAAGADPWDTQFHWGNNAYQYGDLPTALSKLRKAQELNPDAPRSRDSLDRALWQKKFYLNPQGDYWLDSDRRSYGEGGFDLAGHLSDRFKAELFGRRIRWEREGLGEEKGTRLGVGAKWFFVPDHWLEGRLWNLNVDRRKNLWGGWINLRWSNPWWENFVNAQAARETIDTVEAVRADIRADRFALYTYTRLIHIFDLFADLSYTRRTDDNDTLLLNGRLVWRMKEWPYIGLGYAGRWGDSDRKAEEYYAPKRLQQHQLYFNSRGEYQLLHYRFSIQGGYAKEEDTDWRFVWSTQLDLTLRLSRRMDLSGRYRHQESPIYHYDEYGLEFLFRF